MVDRGLKVALIIGEGLSGSQTKIIVVVSTNDFTVDGDASDSVGVVVLKGALLCFWGGAVRYDRFVVQKLITLRSVEISFRLVTVHSIGHLSG